jgi:hypothetical protein
MDRKAMQQLRLDKRLLRRPDWISREELERELDNLPDVSHKIAEPEPEEPGSNPPSAGS